MKRYMVTSALPYTNGPIHIGHLVGAYLPADIYVRYLRSMHKDVLFVCGSDEHGVAITIKARQMGITPQEVIDKYHPIIKGSLEQFGISFDNYSRTSLDIHKETAQEFFKTFVENDQLIEKESEQYFDPEAGIFLPDRYVTGECPVCQNPNAYGDQCEKCGSSLSPTDLKNPKSTITGHTPELRTTKHWFLPLDRMQADWLQGYVDSQKEKWKPNVYGQCQSWLTAGLQPRAITRDLDWGVPVPVEGTEGKVLYVWFDAPIGYISASKDWAQQQGTPDAWKPYWQDRETSLVHFIGKDNIVFHTLIFPAMLHYHGDFIVPDQVPANEFLNLEGDKMSTSRNYAVWLHEYLEVFPDKVDVLRYVLASTMPEAKDNDFSWKDYQARNNNELVAVLGNFVNRVLTLIQKYYEGVVPESTVDLASHQLLKPHYEKLGPAISTALSGYTTALEAFKFREALQHAMGIARAGNLFLQDTEPWKLIKEDPEAVKATLNCGLDIVAQLATVFEPFLPNTSAKLWEMLNNKAISLNNLTPGTWHLIKPGSQLPKPELLFSKIEDDVIEAQLAKLQQAPAPKSLAPVKDEIQFPDFEKIDIRVATITAAEQVPKADRLLKLTLDAGIDTRTVVSGIAEHYKAEDIVGQRVCVLVNLAPRKLRGVESQGMVLMAESPEGELRFVQPTDGLPNGSVVR